MGSVGSVNPGVGDLLQSLYSNSSSLSPVLSSSAVESALQTASSGDLVQLSAQALQLQQTADLFGTFDPSSQISGPSGALLQALEDQDSAGQSTSATTAATASPTDPALTEADDLFGSGSSTISLLG